MKAPERNVKELHKWLEELREFNRKYGAEQARIERSRNDYEDAMCEIWEALEALIGQKATMRIMLEKFTKITKHVKKLEDEIKRIEREKREHN